MDEVRAWRVGAPSLEHLLSSITRLISSYRAAPSNYYFFKPQLDYIDDDVQYICV